MMRYKIEELIKQNLLFCRGQFQTCSCYLQEDGVKPVARLLSTVCSSSFWYNEVSDLSSPWLYSAGYFMGLALEWVTIGKYKHSNTLFIDYLSLLHTFFAEMSCLYCCEDMNPFYLVGWTVSLIQIIKCLFVLASVWVVVCLWASAGVGNRRTAVRTQLTSSPDRDTIATIILIMRFLFYIYNFHQEILTTNVWVTFINPLNTLN